MAAARTVFRNHTHYFVKSRQTIHAAKAQRTHPAKNHPTPFATLNTNMKIFLKIKIVIVK